MVMAFLLKVFIGGTAVPTDEMYFQNINRCNYFAHKIESGTYKDKDTSYYTYGSRDITAYCLPSMVRETTKFWD
tara:strand:- start:270 stop:491 length:222 start_codon:yes stop_codon:yes gene_type:complete